MIVVAGPPGSGKSTAFPVSAFGMDCFNADDRAAALNGDSYLGISQKIRAQVNREFEAFVLSHIERRRSLAFETTLRSSVTFEQASAARAAGFRVEMRYLALNSFASNLNRIKIRADKGGHSAPESVLSRIYQASLNNLPRAIREMDLLRVYDNSQQDINPDLVLETSYGRIIYVSHPQPEWVRTAVTIP